MISRIAFRAQLLKSASRFYSKGSGKTQGAGSKSQTTVDVPGLSEACIHPAAQPVGPNVEPNKSGAYKVPEYFCYDNTTYFEAEIEMQKYRLPQPSALKK